MSASSDVVRSQFYVHLFVTLLMSSSRAPSAIFKQHWHSLTLSVPVGYSYLLLWLCSGQKWKVVGMGSCGIDYLAQVAAFPDPDSKLRTEQLEVNTEAWALTLPQIAPRCFPPEQENVSCHIMTRYY